ncbi:MAG: hypothetical protein IPN13_07960 [Bacteroidetes bacterium]|nr:hypothetical protein [Bacteroidota bacterium]
MATNANGQWNYYCGFNWPTPPPGTSTSFADAEFNSKDSVYSSITLLIHQAQELLVIFV